MKKKILAICLVVALAATAVVGATLAYFTDTEEVENVINIGKVDISLTEPNYTENNQVLMPGTNIVKDPTVTVADDSEDAWLFVEIDWNRYKAFISTAINAEIIKSPNDLMDSDKRKAFVDFFVVGLDHSKWEVMNASDFTTSFDETQEYMPIILGYKTVVHAGEQIPVFSAIKFNEKLDQDDMKLFYEYADGTPKTGANDVNINITAVAVQAANVADLNAAYGIAFPAP